MPRLLFRAALLILTAWIASAQSVPSPNDSTMPPDPRTTSPNPIPGGQASGGLEDSLVEPRFAIERDWAELQTQFGPGRPSQPETLGSGSRQDAAAQFLSAADKAKAFRSKHPLATALVAQSRRLEAQALFSAIMAGDESLEQRASDTLNEVRSAPSLSQQERFEVVALAELAEGRKHWGSSEQRLDYGDKSARRLIAEFPQLSGGYEALLRHIQNHPDPVVAESLAIELQSMSAPGAVKKAAKLFSDRHNLVGRSIIDIAREVPGISNVFEQATGKVVVIYTWATWSPGSIARAKDMMQLAPEKISLFGLNLDQEAARSVAVEELLPGELLYDSEGVAGALSRALCVGSALPIYLVDHLGVVVSVSENSATISEAVRQLQH